MLTENIKHSIKTAAIWTANNPLAQTFARHFHKHQILFIAYHGVAHDTEELEAWTLVRETAFRQQMVFLKNNFECITIEDALHQNARNQKRPAVVVTFDDGYANNLEIALPIMDQLNIPLTVYITTKPLLERELFWPDIIWTAAKRSHLNSIDLTEIAEPLGFYHLDGSRDCWQKQILKILEDIKNTDPQRRKQIVEDIVTKFKTSPSAINFQIEVENNVFTPLTQNQLSMLASHHLVTIGAHSHCHNLLDQIPSDQAKKSIQKSRNILENLTGLQIKHFAYPNGNFNPTLVEIVKRMNFKSAVTFQPGFYKIGDNQYTINRFGIGSDFSLDLFKALLTGIFELKKKIFP